jgi:hypothetical protein
MPSPENPYRPDEALFDIFENGGPELRQALRDDYDKTRNDRFYDDMRTEIGGLATQTLQALADPYAPTAWGQPDEIDFRCPSGQLCRVRRVDVVDLLGGGLLNKLDIFTAAANEATPDAKKNDAAAKVATGILGDTENMDQFKTVMAEVVRRVVIKPALWADPPDGEEKVPGCIYVSSVAFTDRVAIFNWAVTGKQTEEIKQFREPAGESVGDVEPVEVVQHETVELPRD